MFHRSLSVQVINWNSISRSASTVSKALYDSHGRRHDYLRVSLTEKCNLRCRYCAPEEGIQLGEREMYLNLDELKRLSDIFVKFCGITKIRLTGGEPTIDRKMIPFLSHLDQLKKFGLRTIAMTTNGMTLGRNSSLLRKSGLNAINISLDTLRADRFEILARRKGWNQAYQGLISAIRANFDVIKLNCVLMKGFNDDEVIDFAKLAQKYPIEVRFIEFMPFAGNRWAEDRMIPYQQTLQLLKREYPLLNRINTGSNEVSKVYRDPSMLGSIGFISSMSENFCSGCNRIRLTSDGNLKVCLFGREETSLRDLIRHGASDCEIVDSIIVSLRQKKKQHAVPANLQKDTSRPMIKIGTRKFHSSSDENEGAHFSHLNARGEASMVNVSKKAKSRRIARSQGRIYVGERVLAQIYEQTMKKGDVLTVAKVSGIMGAKLTSNLIPLCHQIPLDNVQVDIEPCRHSGSLLVTCSVEAHHNTGVEMESLVAVTTTLLTLFDMCKSINKSMEISDVKLIAKSKD